MKKITSSMNMMLMHMCCCCMCRVSRTPKSDVFSFFRNQLCAT